MMGKPDSSFANCAFADGHTNARLDFLAILSLAFLANFAAISRGGGPFTAEDHQLWSLQPIRQPALPDVDGSDWVQSAIDRFILARLNQAGLCPAPLAERRTLIRRLTYNLHGLPPSPGEVDAFVSDPRPDAYQRLVDRLLSSPRYGEQWARYWLDLVRYAESDGYKADSYRPSAWRYRDYVISSLNRDKPYDEFVREQLAGDEINPADPESLIATSFLRLGIYEYNQSDVETQWHVMLDDITNVTADVFLGLGMNCARCHDHKFDPILQKDYYRLRAFFAPIFFRDELPVAAVAEVDRYRRELAAWEAEAADLKAEMERLVRPHREAFVAGRLGRFPQPIQAMLLKSATARTPYERQLAQLAGRQIITAEEDIATISGKLDKQDKQQWEKLSKSLRELENCKPAPLPIDLRVTDVGPIAPATVIPGDSSQEDVWPGYLSILDPRPASIFPSPVAPNSTGRRLALARWITEPDNRLSVRVIVNRIWQYHFGQGIVRSASDFGRLGDLPSHPELLDWLAIEFVNNGWSLKYLHRLILNSATYQQSYQHPQADFATQIDPGNTLLWRAPLRRLAAEEIHDAMLAISGELEETQGGPSADLDQPRRSIYLKTLRNKMAPLCEVFDGAERIESCSRRYVTTTAPQALFMINSEYTLTRAERFAKRVTERADPEDLENGFRRPAEQIVVDAYRLAYGRDPDPQETTAALEFLGVSSASTTAGVADMFRVYDFCHVLINSNEFLYVE